VCLHKIHTAYGKRRKKKKKITHPDMKNPNALAEAQSASELFDVMQPPLEKFDIFTSKGVSTGEVKTRGLVHRDQDWHRSVHVWLVDREQQVVALQKRSPNKVRAMWGVVHL
jgi:hypothetical protein